MPATSSSTRRLLKELSDFRKSRSTPSSATEAVVELSPVDDEDLMVWAGSVRGPESSPWTGEVLEVLIHLEPTYPSKPPTISFRPRTVFHPNVTLKTGEICLDVLKTDWSPAWTLASALLAVQSLLASPEPSSPLNVDAANLVRCEDRAAFASLARMYVDLARASS